MNDAEIIEILRGEPFHRTLDDIGSSIGVTKSMLSHVVHRHKQLGPAAHNKLLVEIGQYQICPTCHGEGVLGRATNINGQ